ncbi:MAG: ribonuclease D [Acidobacteriota bacterium]|nr:ribonuclease D [Acidobacteriota bacterium]
MLDFSIKLVTGPRELDSLAARLESAPALALDLETADWWDRRAERVALVQLAFREGRRLRVAVVDALAGLDLGRLRTPLELGAVTKAIHNAAYDAERLSRHFRIRAAPIHDTMLAARRGGEKRCSLQAQAEAHLGIRLDKGEQRGDWGRRPLTAGQLRYAALDAACTLLLYEDQMARGLSAGYRPREEGRSRQTSLPLGDASRATPDPGERPRVVGGGAPAAEGLHAPAIALLGVVTELAGRYSPERLAVSAGSERVGLMGWIIDRALGAEADLDEDTARVEIAELCERGLARLDAGRRLEATEAGARLWREVKPA